MSPLPPSAVCVGVLVLLPSAAAGVPTDQLAVLALLWGPDGVVPSVLPPPRPSPASMSVVPVLLLKMSGAGRTLLPVGRCGGGWARALPPTGAPPQWLLLLVLLPPAAPIAPVLLLLPLCHAAELHGSLAGAAGRPLPLLVPLLLLQPPRPAATGTSQAGPLLPLP
jgi:hypothetical protein